MSSIAALSGVLLFGSLLAAGQTPDDLGTTRAQVTGTITDRAGTRSGAAVLLTSSGRTLEATSDEEGHFRLGGLEPGRWNVRVSAEGCLDSTGFVDVRPPQVVLDVEVRRLDEGTPRFAEGAPGPEVKKWLELGNALLADGKAAQARREYQKTLAHLDLAERAEVVRAIARTHYLEGDLARARRALEDALKLDPASEDTKALLAALPPAAESVSAEVHPRSARPETDRSTSPPRARVRPPRPPVVDLTHTLEGSNTVRLDERAELGHMREVDRRYGLEPEWLQQASDYDIGGEAFALHVPEGYHHRRPDESWGVLVWVSPTADGRPPQGEALEILASHRLIWIGAHDAGNPRPLWERIGLAVDAAAAIGATYDVAPHRTYVGGYSGGGRLASALALHWPEVFRGALAWFGVSWYEPVPVPYSPGRSWAPAFRKPTSRRLQDVRDHSHFALVTGDLDFNRSETVATHRLMQRAKLDAALLQIPDADHYAGLVPEWLHRALAALDSLDGSR